MFEYISQIFQVKGPAVKVKFFMDKDQIFEIQVAPSEKNLIWQIESDKKSLKIEKDITLWMQTYAKRENPSIKLPLDLSHIPSYTSLVLHHVYSISMGETCSYQEIAKRTGKPKAARAVGNACGRNPFPFIIPCHRVLASNGSLGGYSGGGGLDVKKRLLSFESHS